MRSVGETISSHQNNFTAIRLIFSISVIYFHSFALGAPSYTEYVAADLLSPATDVGGLAVDGFFFLSGLFVTQSFAREQNVANFLIRRFTRIWPGLFVCLIVTAAISCVITRGPQAWTYLVDPDTYRYIFSNSIFQLRWTIADVFAGRRWAVINGSIHTLPLEVKMYGILVLAGILGLLSTRGRLAIVGLILLAVDLIHPEFFTVPFSVQNYGQAPIGMFFLGIITYGCCSFLRPKLWHLGLILLVMSLMSGAERNMLFFVLVALTCLYIGQLEWLCSAVKLPNDYSYGIYIYGWPCQQIVLTFDRHATPYGLAALAIPLAILFAMASWFLIEKPAIGLGKAAIALRPRLRSARRVVVPSV